MDPSEETSAGKDDLLAIDDSNQDKAKQATVVSDESKAPIIEKKKKKKMVRYTQEQIEYCIAIPEELWDIKVIKLTELLSKECLARMGQEQVDKLYAMERTEEEQIVRRKKLQEVSTMNGRTSTKSPINRRTSSSSTTPKAMPSTRLLLTMEMSMSMKTMKFLHELLTLAGEDSATGLS
ncbi:uncharacterized protein LOC127783007 [Oryza glaberrima]|uniref:uncharacterized protein LOC127783007 n=1 Tax=Oryza glaberrima TaxID=4538 RepID=UPI00224BFA9B|nr:uncharacterized protein LOC127783007 [Oryza glaberrima]